MEDHLLEKHPRTENDNNNFKCGDCAYTTMTNEELGRHVKETHNKRTQAQNSDNHDTIEVVNEEEEESRAKSDLKVLRSNFERLEVMYRESLDEVNKVRSEYEAKLMEANDKLINDKIRK